MTKKKTTKKETPKVNKDLEGFDIKVNSFGEIITSYDLDKVNEFLDKNVEDKKLKDRPGFLKKSETDTATEEFSSEDEK